jgi:adenosylhomocysteinase
MNMNQVNGQDYWIKDMHLSGKGELYCGEALLQMKGLGSLREKYASTKPLVGIKVLGAGVMTYECANFAVLLKDLGADVRWVTDSLHYTIDSAAAYMVSKGIPTFGFRHMTEEQYDKAYHLVQYKDENENVISPDFVISDGAEMSMFMDKNYPEALSGVRAILEQTTSGMNKYYSLFIPQDNLYFTVIDINGSVTKSKFDNIYGSRESLLEGIQRSLNIQIAGEETVVFGFGEVGKGCAQVMRGLGAHVSVVEIDPIMAMQAHMDGYTVLSKDEALSKSKIIITATSCIKTIAEKDMEKIRDGALLMNMSEHNMEIDTEYFKETSKFLEVIELNENCKRYTLPNGRKVYLLCDGYVLNLYAGYGHPPTVMGTTYTTHALALIDCVIHPENYTGKAIHHLPRKLDEEVARMSLPEVAEKLTRIDEEQEKYLGIQAGGPYKKDTYKY